MVGFAGQHVSATRNFRTPSIGAAAVLLRPFAPTFSNPEPCHRPGRLWSKTFLHPPLGAFFACASPQEAEGALSVGCVRPTPPWTPWLKVLGCCARAGPVAHSCPRIPVLQRLRSHVPRSVVPSCPLARAVRLDAPGSCKERAATRLDAFRFDLLLHAVGAPRATCCALASMAIGPATQTSAAIPRHAPS